MPAVMDTLLRHLTWMGTWDPGSGARDALIASGRLELIGDLELRNHLSGWQGWVDEVRDNQLAAREMILTNINPFLAERGVPLDRVKAVVDDEWPAVLTTDAEAAPVYQKLFADPVFRGHVVLRYAWLDLSEYDDAISIADSILAAIESELRR